MTTILLVTAIVVVAVLTASATVLRSAGRLWLRQWAERRLRGSIEDELYLDRPQRYLLATAIGSAVAANLSGALLGVTFRATPTVFALAIISAGIVFFLVQLLARAIGRRWASELLQVVLPVLRAAELITAPMLAASPAVERRLERSSDAVSEISDYEDITELLRDGEVEGIVAAEERAIITGVAEFGATEVAEVMTPRSRIFALPAALSARDLSRQIAQCPYSRVPLHHGSLDCLEGMVHVFDVLKVGRDGVPVPRPIPEVSGAMRCSELLFRMLRRSEHLAIVRDAEGSTIGLVTLDDLLEKLVGEIRADADEPQAPRAA